MNNRMRKAIFLCALLISALAGCAGETGSGSALGGIDGGGFARGTISGFGSIIVNGVEYSTDNAIITIDGRPGTQADLAVGDVVSIVGHVDANGTTGTATSVTFDDDVEGPVQSVDAVNGVIIVLDQTVHVNGGTSFGDGSSACTLTGVQPGTILEVSGFRDSAGDIVATRIECKPPGGELEVTGTVQSVDTTQRRFQIGALTVDYSQAQLQGFPAGQPAAQQTVEVKGAGFSNGALLAARVDFKDASLLSQAGERADLEGLITRFVSAADFDVSGQRVTTSASTRFDNCGAAFSPPLNSEVEIKGVVEGSAIRADEVECSSDPELRVRAPVESVGPQTGSLTVLGVPISTSATTRFEDKSSAALLPFNATDLRTGDLVEVHGNADSQSGGIAAVILERLDPQPGVELRGTAQSVMNQDLVVLGVTAHTTTNTLFEDESESPITAVDFFARAPGRLVEVEGTDVGGVIQVGTARLAR